MGETVGQAEREQLSAVVETLAQAFQTDPALSWILPDPDHRARALRGLHSGEGGAAGRLVRQGQGADVQDAGG